MQLKMHQIIKVDSVLFPLVQLAIASYVEQHLVNAIVWQHLSPGYIYALIHMLPGISFHTTEWASKSCGLTLNAMKE